MIRHNGERLRTCLDDVAEFRQAPAAEASRPIGGAKPRGYLTCMRRAVLTSCLTFFAAQVAAHPHVFVATDVEIVFDASGFVAGVRLSWTYDEFFSFMLTEELGLDTDGDLIMTEDELEVLSESILDWPADFSGDLFASQGGVPVTFGPRAEASVDYIDGQVIERHYRPLATLVEVGGPLNVQVYDPFYYVAYEISSGIVLNGGTSCVAELRKADLNAAYSLVDELLYGRPASDVGPDEAFPEVGEAFSDTVVVTCGG